MIAHIEHVVSLLSAINQITAAEGILNASLKLQAFHGAITGFSMEMSRVDRPEFLRVK